MKSASNGLHINGVFSCLHIEKVTGADKKNLEINIICDITKMVWYSKQK